MAKAGAVLLEILGLQDRQGHHSRRHSHRHSRRHRHREDLQILHLHQDRSVHGRRRLHRLVDHLDQALICFAELPGRRPWMSSPASLMDVALALRPKHLHCMALPEAVHTALQSPYTREVVELLQALQLQEMTQPSLPATMKVCEQ